MNPEIVPILTVTLTGLSLLLIPFLPARLKSLTALLLIVANAIVTTIPAVGVLSGKTFALTLAGGSHFGSLLLEVDPLSAWFILIVNFTLVNGAFYGMGYLKAYQHRKADLSLHGIMLVVFHTSMLWVCMLQNGFAFLIAWEIMTLASLVLVLFEHNKANTLQAGINYMVQMHIGVAFLTLAFIWVFVTQHTTGFGGIGTFLQQPGGHWVILFFFIGFGIKAGFVPLHTWLPHAHPAAPSHVSGVMSGVIVKMGIYGLLRVAMLMQHNLLQLGVLMVVISAVTTLYGILNASVHRDFKKMLAFCTTENIGIIGMGIGMGLIGNGIDNPAVTTLGFGAALLHTLNHSLYKSLLFFTSGNIYLKTHTRNMELLGGLIRYMPHTALVFLTGALAIGGMPPFNGFISKLLIYSGFFEAFRHNQIALSALMVLSAAILAMAGGVSVLTFAKSFGTLFLGEPRSEYTHQPVEVPFAMRLPLYLIIAVMLVVGLFPQALLNPLFAVIAHMQPGLAVETGAGITHTLTLAGRASLLLLAVIVVLLLVRKGLFRYKPVGTSPTWGCGYTAPSPVMQYTGKSFSKNLAKLFGFITIENKKYRELRTESIFPSARTYASNYLEFFETRLFEPVTRQFLRIFDLFTFIHNGKIQFYVLYGLLFVVILLVLTLTNVL